MNEEDDAAPDYRQSAVSKPKSLAQLVRKRRNRKKPITLTVHEDMINRLDDLAHRRGMSRAAVMILAFSEHLERSNS